MSPKRLHGVSGQLLLFVIMNELHRSSVWYDPCFYLHLDIKVAYKYSVDMYNVVLYNVFTRLN